MKFIPVTRCLFILCLSVSFAHGQILNIERYRLDKDTFNVWMGNIGLGFSNKKQAVSVLNYNANANLAYLSKKHSYMTINYIKLQQVAKSNIISEGYTHWRLNFNRKQYLSYEPFIQLQYDLGRGMQERYLAGFSLRANLQSKDHFVLGFNTGAMWEHEVWTGTVLRPEYEIDTLQAETNFFKSTSNLSLRYNLSKQITFFTITYYQAPFNDFFHPRLISDTHLQFSIGSRFALNNQFVANIDAAPVVQNNNFTYSFTSSLVFKVQ